jgi:hypothetical protein
MTRLADGRLLAHASTTCLLMLPAQAPADAEAA